MARKIGIMQGRLSAPVDGFIQTFPLARWGEEFSRAREAGLHHLEWIFSREDLANPIAGDEGVAGMLALSAESGVGVHSLCADYFMFECLLEGTEEERNRRREKLQWLLERCAAAGLRHLVLPFVDQSEIRDAIQHQRLVALLGFLLPALDANRLELHLETSLAPRPLAALLRQVGSPRVKINYDTGNSAALGYDPGDECEAYGSWIGSVHLKDRVRGGATVPLGRGHVDFPRLARLLRQIDYQGDFTLQVARDKPGGEMQWARQNVKFWQDIFPG